MKPLIYSFTHAESESIMFMQVEKKKGKVVITDLRFAQGNVVDLMAVRRALTAAKKILK